MISCENQEEIKIKFEQKKFIPSTTEEVNYRVKDFLSHTSATTQTNGALRTVYDDKEVNEGFWTLEAAANYISNVNLDNKLETTITYTLNIDNKVDNGVIMMDGPDMTVKFDDLQALIDASATDLSKVAKIVDAQLVSANDQQTVINFRVLFGANPPPPEDCEWDPSTQMPIAGELISGCISENLPQYHYYSDVRDYRAGETSEFQNCFFDHFYNIALFRETYDPFPSEEMDQYYDEIMNFINCAIIQLEPNDGSIHMHSPLTPIRVFLPSQGGMWNWLGTEFNFDELILGRVVAYD